MDPVEIFRQVCLIAGLILAVATSAAFLGLPFYLMRKDNNRREGDRPAILTIDRQTLTVMEAPPEVWDMLREHEDLGTPMPAILYVIKPNDPDDHGSHTVSTLDAMEIPTL